jgi:hypothetical protein
MYAITETQENHTNLSHNTINSTPTFESWPSTLSMHWAQSDVPQKRLDILHPDQVFQHLISIKSPNVYTNN